MFDEIYCDATLPDGRDPRGTCFQTKSLPDPCMCRYRITSAGRLIDSAGNDLEPDGYILFYTVDRENGDSEAPGKRSEEHTSELQSQFHLVCRLLLETKKTTRVCLYKPSSCSRIRLPIY